MPVNHPPHSELHLDALQLIYADAYVLVAVLVLALAEGSALSEPRPSVATDASAR